LGHAPKYNRHKRRPEDCPTSRPVDCRPLAPPPRPGGALPMITLLFRDWENPNPNPQIAKRQAILIELGLAG
jgi:hypothetical protein